ncbi:transcriptional regulator [Litoribrevibacter albus]|uniref:Transcriptional regulator n=2 Tax=Litoribrevibacter albus TaxID=1473156 RepID=A0AA37S6B8_9GAMM|nr:transcriptional regulator [Litoribrevibacter albus]
MEHGLQPVQFDALYYLSVCNRFSDTPKGVTEYLGLTKGTVSQSIKVLEAKGFVEKRADLGDKRITHLVITSKGRAMVADLFPATVLKHLTDDSESYAEFKDAGLDLELLEEQLKTLLSLIQQQNQRKTFGQCATCTHLRHNPDGSHFCGLTQELLSHQDTQLICIEHS